MVCGRGEETVVEFGDSFLVENEELCYKLARS